MRKAARDAPVDVRAATARPRPATRARRRRCAAQARPPSRQATRPRRARPRRGCRVRLEPRAEREQLVGCNACPAAAAPATRPSPIAAALEPRPRSSGIAFVNRNVYRSTGRATRTPGARDGSRRAAARRRLRPRSRRRTALLELHRVPEVERRGGCVEPRPEVRGRCGCARDDHSSAASTASSDASTTVAADASTACGVLEAVTGDDADGGRVAPAELRRARRRRPPTPARRTHLRCARASTTRHAVRRP